MMRAWSYVQPDMRALVYPRPDSAPLPPRVPTRTPATRSPRARGRTISRACGLTRQAILSTTSLEIFGPERVPAHKLFAGRTASELWFDWDSLPAGMLTEARLSRLARWVVLAEERGLRYGLALRASMCRSVKDSRTGIAV